jgi:hypothetical protein
MTCRMSTAVISLLPLFLISLLSGLYFFYFSLFFTLHPPALRQEIKLYL